MILIALVVSGILLACCGPYIVSALATMVGWWRARDCRWCSDGDTYCDKHGRSA